MSQQTSERLLMLLHRVNGLLHRAQSQSRGGLEMGHGQGRLLRHLYREDGISQKELADRVNISPASLSELVVKLEEKGQVIRKVSPTDKRVLDIFITDHGRETAEIVQKARSKVAVEVFETLSEGEQEQLTLLLEKLMNSLVEAYPHGTDHHQQEPKSPN